MSAGKILIIEDDPDGRRSVMDAMESLDYGVGAAVSGEEGLERLAAEVFDAVLCDYRLPGMDGMEVLARIKARDSEMPVLIMTAFGDVPMAVQAIQAGAYDFLTKPLDLGELQATVGRAVEARRLRSEVRQLRETVGAQQGVGAMVAGSACMRPVLEQVRALADTVTTVLIQGESGTGKELVARALHFEGRRRAGPFVAVNCGAFTDSLLESELFGHEKGAFTGATERRKGAFERAHGGTLFLDEVGNAPQAVQIKLLRVLEERELFRVGGQSAVRVDVRVLSASNQSLDDLVEEGSFRRDLLYRLNVFTLVLPPLRERREDLRPLSERFMRDFCRIHGRPVLTIGAEAYRAIEAYEWPGNVRQLRNAMESAVVMNRDGVITSEALRLGGAAALRPDEGNWSVPEGRTLAEMEKEILMQLLQRNEGNRTLVAEKLGLARRTIQRKIKEYDLPY